MSEPSEYGDLREALGNPDLGPELLERALTHRSFAYENGGLPTNERLEFLGDSVLGFVVGDLLFSLVNYARFVGVVPENALRAQSHQDATGYRKNPWSWGTLTSGTVQQLDALGLAAEQKRMDVEEMRRAFDSRRKLMYGLVSDIPGVRCVEPQGAFYVFPEVTDALEGRWASTDELATVILEEAGVALVPGESFGTPGFLRLSYAVGEADIERGMDRIRRLLAR